MGALRLLTNSKVMGEFVLSSEQFWQGWDLLLADDRFVGVAEPSNLESVWRQITTASEKSWADTDTYLAAFAIAGGHKLVTFDRGFQKYLSLKLEILA